MRSWRELRDRADQFAELGATLLGITCDAPDELARMVVDERLPFTMLSDPDMVYAAALELPRATARAYYSTRTLHPELSAYPKTSFLQPAVLVWTGAELKYQWRQNETILNLFGARGRPTGDEVLDIVRACLG